MRSLGKFHQKQQNQWVAVDLFNWKKYLKLDLKSIDFDIAYLYRGFKTLTWNIQESHEEKVLPWVQLQKKSFCIRIQHNFNVPMFSFHVAIQPISIQRISTTLSNQENKIIWNQQFHKSTSPLPRLQRHPDLRKVLPVDGPRKKAKKTTGDFKSWNRPQLMVTVFWLSWICLLGFVGWGYLLNLYLPLLLGGKASRDIILCNQRFR